MFNEQDTSDFKVVFVSLVNSKSWTSRLNTWTDTWQIESFSLIFYVRSYTLSISFSYMGQVDLWTESGVHTGIYLIYYRDSWLIKPDILRRKTRFSGKVENSRSKVPISIFLSRLLWSYREPQDVDRGLPSTRFHVSLQTRGVGDEVRIYFGFSFLVH